jgi:phage terminase large subunit-like protein
VPADEVHHAVKDAFDLYDVWRLYADPPYWESTIAAWAGQFGTERVIEWWTNRRRQMSAALKAFDTAIRDGKVPHCGDPIVTRHIGNARRDDLKGWRDEQGHPLWLIRKDRPDSPHKIDAAMASVLSWEARNDAIAAGALSEAGPSIYETRGLQSV